MGVCVCVCKCKRAGLCVCFTAAQSIYSISMVLSLHNHISTDLKSHTCCSAIYLEGGFIASNVSPRELRMALYLFAPICVCVCACVSILI